MNGIGLGLGRGLGLMLRRRIAVAGAAATVALAPEFEVDEGYRAGTGRTRPCGTRAIMPGGQPISLALALTLALCRSLQRERS